MLFHISINCIKKSVVSSTHSHSCCVMLVVLTRAGKIWRIGNTTVLESKLQTVKTALTSHISAKESKCILSRNISRDTTQKSQEKKIFWGTVTFHEKQTSKQTSKHKNNIKRYKQCNIVMKCRFSNHFKYISHYKLGLIEQWG